MPCRRLPERRDALTAQEHHVADLLGLEREDRLLDALAEGAQLGGVDPEGLDRAVVDARELRDHHVVDDVLVEGLVGRHDPEVVRPRTSCRPQRGHQAVGEGVIAGQARLPQVRRQRGQALVALRHQRLVQHQRARLGVAGTRAGLELPVEDHGEDLVVLGQLLAQCLLGLRGVTRRLEGPDDGLDLTTADAAVGVGPVHQGVDLVGGDTLARHLEAQLDGRFSRSTGTKPSFSVVAVRPGAATSPVVVPVPGESGRKPSVVALTHPVTSSEQAAATTTAMRPIRTVPPPSPSPVPCPAGPYVCPGVRNAVTN